jgi:hypothetical protein
LHASFVLRSTDNGRSFGRPVCVSQESGRWFSEPALVQSSTGRLVCLSREEETGFLYQSDSLDDGISWSRARQLALWGYPAHIVALSGARLLVTYGRRRPPFSIRMAISDDDGATWGSELVVCDEFYNDNFGYPTTVELEPGRLLTVYYGEDGDGTSSVYAVEVGVNPG